MTLTFDLPANVLALLLAMIVAIPDPCWAVEPQCSLFSQPFYRNLIDALQVELPMMANDAVELRVLTPFRTLANDPLNGTEFSRSTNLGTHRVRSDFGIPSGWNYVDGAQRESHEFFYEYALHFTPGADARHWVPATEYRLHPYSPTAAVHARYAAAVKETFDFYDLRRTVSEEKVDRLRAAEAQFDPRRAVQFFLRRPETVALAGSLRIVDGSAVPFLTSGSDPRATAKLMGDDPRIPIERAFPELKLRGDGADIYEIGKFAVDENLVNGTPVFLRSAAIYLQMKYGGEIPANAWIYAVTPEKIARIHTRRPPPGYVPRTENAQGNFGYGFRRFRSPEDLGFGADDRDRVWILELSVREFVALYLRYQAPPRWR